MNKVNINLCPSPDLFSQYALGDTKYLVIIVDILRATSSIVTAFGNCASSILTVSSVEECQKIGSDNGYLMAAERNIRRCDFAQLGNDPNEYTEDIVKGQTIVMTTTNGTRSISIAKENSNADIIIGAFLNINATARYIIDNNYKDVIILAAGWKGQVSLEDCLYSGALSSALQSMGINTIMNDMAYIMDSTYKDKATDLDSRSNLISHSEHYKRLVTAGLESSCRYCLSVDVFDFVVKLSPDGFLRRV